MPPVIPRPPVAHEVSCKVESNTKEWALQSSAIHFISAKVWMFDTRQQTEKGTDTNGTHPRSRAEACSDSLFGEAVV